jgi:hypothetical protein
MHCADEWREGSTEPSARNGGHLVRPMRQSTNECAAIPVSRNATPGRRRTPIMVVDAVNRRSSGRSCGPRRNHAARVPSCRSTNRDAVPSGTTRIVASRSAVITQKHPVYGRSGSAASRNRISARWMRVLLIVNDVVGVILTCQSDALGLFRCRYKSTRASPCRP